MAKMSTMFLKICKLAGADASKVLEEYNKTARVRGSSTVNYVPIADNNLKAIQLAKKAVYLFVNAEGKIFSIPEKITRKADGKVCVFHTAYQAVQTKKADVTPPTPPKTSGKKS